MLLNTVTILDSNSKIFSNDRHMQIHTYKYTTYNKCVHYTNTYMCVCSVAQSGLTLRLHEL